MQVLGRDAGTQQLLNRRGRADLRDQIQPTIAEPRPLRSIATVNAPTLICCWLDPDLTDPGEIASLLRPYPADLLVARPAAG